MRVSCSMISTIILLAGQSQSAPILGPNGLESRDGLVGGMTHSAQMLPATGVLNDGLLGKWKSKGLLGGTSAGKSLTGTGDGADAALISRAGLRGKPTLKKLSSPLVSEGGTVTKVQSMASSLRSNLSVPLPKRDTFSALDAVLEKTPLIGYLPGVAQLPAIPSLPVVRDFPGISLIPGLGATKAPSGFVADLTEPILAVLPAKNPFHGATQNSTLLASPRQPAIQSPTKNLTSSFSAIVKDFAKVPEAIASLL